MKLVLKFLCHGHGASATDVLCRRNEPLEIDPARYNPSLSDKRPKSDAFLPNGQVPHNVEIVDPLDPWMRILWSLPLPHYVLRSIYSSFGLVLIGGADCLE